MSVNKSVNFARWSKYAISHAPKKQTIIIAAKALQSGWLIRPLVAGFEVTGDISCTPSFSGGWCTTFPFPHRRRQALETWSQLFSSEFGFDSLLLRNARRLKVARISGVTGSNSEGIVVLGLRGFELGDSDAKYAVILRKVPPSEEKVPTSPTMSPSSLISHALRSCHCFGLF